MKKLISLVIVGIFLISGLGAASQQTADGNGEYKQAIENLQTFSVELNVDIPDINLGIENTKGGTFTTIEIEDNGYTIIEGQAKLPVINYMVQIPYGNQPTASVHSDNWEYANIEELNLPKLVIPVQPSIVKKENPEEVEFIMDYKYYQTNSFMQKEKVKIVETGIIRGHRFALLQISPIQYNPATADLKILKSCTVQIEQSHADMKQTLNNIEKYTTNTHKNFFEDIFINYDSFEPNNIASTHGSVGYLIIVHDDFYSEITSFAEWKESMFYDVTVTKTSEIPGSPTKENIQSYIQDAYDSWSTPPSYVLLVGDVEQIPAFTGGSSNTATDLYYAAIDGSDYFADIYIGRFPGNQVSHIAAMVDKTLGYEKGQWANNDFVKKAAFMASVDNYAISEGTHNYVIDNYFDPLGFTCDKLYSVTYGATTQDVRNSLNDGRGLAIYSGHGSTTSWADGPPFSQSDVNALSNQGMLSFVGSHACVTGKYSYSECFGETWIRAPNKAAIIFWGSSANTLWGEDDVLEKNYCKYYDDFQPVSHMTDKGKIDLYAHYGGGGYTQYYFECYNIFGDPSVIIGVSYSGGGNGGGGDDDGGGSNNDFLPPRVGITNPSYGDYVSDTINVTGYSYSLGGQIRYVYVKIGHNYGSWTRAYGTQSWYIPWDTTSVPDGEIIIQAVSIDKSGHQSGVDFVTINVKNIPDPLKYPDLTCEGSLTWTNITPGVFIYKDLALENIGDNESLLNWEISEYPEDWGAWAINPSNGVNLTPDHGKITIRISVKAPEESEQSFTGQLKIINKDDPSDFDIIPITLSTQKSKPNLNEIFHRFFQNFPNMLPFLQFLLGI